MGIGKVKLRKADRLFTQYIRILFKYTCQRCGRVYSPDGDLHNLGVSHYFSRRHESVRFDVDNVTLLCSLPCHYLWEHEDRLDYIHYMVKRLGKERFKALQVRANTTQKKDDKLVEIYLKAKLKEL